MSSNKNFTEIESLERYRIALENVVKQTEIATAMAEFGYDSEAIALDNNPQLLEALGLFVRS